VNPETNYHQPEKENLMKKIFKTLIFLLIPLGAFSQLTPLSNQYVLNPLTINPAYAGNRGALNLAAFYRRQWVGIAGSPETMTLSIDAPVFDNKVGLGLIILNDKIGVTKETRFITNYAYKIAFDKGDLSLGLGAGLITTNTKWSDLIALDPGDESFLADSRLFVVPSISFGTYYSNNKYFAGFSIPKFISYSFDFNKNKYSLMLDPKHYSYMFSTGYLFYLSPKVNILPSTLVIISPSEKILYDINVHVNFLERFWAGASYRSGRSVAGLFQFQVNNQLKVAYTYDFDFGKLRTYSNGSHEVMVRYEFRYEVDVVNPLIF
jgi:type IX secretion system PorP/SprF family membrane protein